MTSGPVIALKLRKENAIDDWCGARLVQSLHALLLILLLLLLPLLECIYIYIPPSKAFATCAGGP